MTTFSLSRKGRKSTLKSTNIRDFFKSAVVPSSPSGNITTVQDRSTVLALGEFGQILSPPTPQTGCTIPLAGLRARSNSLDLDGWPAKSSSSVGYEVKHVGYDAEGDSRLGYLVGVPIAQDLSMASIPSQTKSIGRSGNFSRLFGLKRNKEVRESSVEPLLDAPEEAVWFRGDKPTRKFMTLPNNRQRRGTFVGDLWSVKDTVRSEEKDLVVVPANSDVVPSLNFPPLPPTPVIAPSTLLPSPCISEQVEPPTPYPTLTLSPLAGQDERIKRWRSSSISYSSCSTVVAPSPNAEEKVDVDPARDDESLVDPDVIIDELDVTHQRSMEDMQRAYKRMREISDEFDGSACESKRSSVVLAVSNEEVTQVTRRSLTFDALDTALKAVVSENMNGAVPRTPTVPEVPNVVSLPVRASTAIEDNKTDRQLERLQQAARAVPSPSRNRASSIKCALNTNALSAPTTPIKSTRNTRRSGEEPTTPQRSSRIVRIVEPIESPVKIKPSLKNNAKSLGLGRPSSTPVIEANVTNRISSFSYLDAPAGSTPNVELERQNDIMVVLLLRKLAERDEENRKLREQIVALESRGL